jgi:hypothetical protein
VHAAGESSPGNLTDGTYAVVLGTANEQELRNLEDRLIAGGLGHKAIREPTMNNSLTAIGMAPAPKSSLRRWLSSIPLYR